MTCELQEIFNNKVSCKQKNSHLKHSKILITMMHLKALNKHCFELICFVYTIVNGRLVMTNFEIFFFAALICMTRM